MYKNAKISAYQLFVIMICFMIGSTGILNPVSAAGQDGWLAFLFGSMGGFVLIFIYVAIAKLNPSKTLVEILNSIFGNVLGTLFSICYIWYFIHLAAAVLRNYGEYYLIVRYTETPIIFIIICFTAVCVYAVRTGIEATGRISEVFLFILVVVIFFMFFALIGMYDIENFKPFLSKGLSPLVKPAFTLMTLPFGEIVVFLMIFPHTNKQNNIFKAAVWSVIVYEILFIVVLSRNLMVLGADMLVREVFPSHVVFRLVPGLDMDPVLDVNLSMALFAKVSICLYAAVTSISEVFRLKSYKTIVLPVAAFIVPLSIWLYDSQMEMAQWVSEIWPIYSIPFQIVIPLIVLLISIKRGRKNKIYMNR